MGSVNFDRSTGIPTTVPQDRLSFRKITGNFAELYVGSNSGVPIKVTDSSKQPTLVSGTNIKTVNNESLLGSGDINIVGIDSGKYACSVWKEGDAVNPVTGTIGTYNAVWHNDGQLNTTTGVYTVPVTGLYNVQFDCLKHGNNTTTEVRLYRNGSATGVRSYMNTTNASEYTNGHFNVTGNFTIGDTLDVRVTVGGVHGNESCYLNIMKVR